MLKHLTKLDLSSNIITGELPKEWSELVNLRGLYLNDNDLSGMYSCCWFIQRLKPIV